MTNTENDNLIQSSRYVKIEIILLEMIRVHTSEVPFLSAIESKKHHGASEPGPHFTNET